MERWTVLMSEVEARHGVVARTELLGAGMSPAAVERWRRAGRLVDVTAGVYRIAGAPATFESEVMAAVAGFGSDTWASHHTAGRLWEHGPPSRTGLIEVTRLTPLSAGRAGVHVHRSTLVPPHHVTTVRGIPVTTPARTLFDLARTTGPRQLDRALARAVRTRLCTVASVYRVLYDLGGRGRPGTRRLRQVLEGWDAHEPPLESELDEVGRALLRCVPGIRWQVPLADERGHIRQVDALVPPAGLVIEFDGRATHDQPAVGALDDDQDRRLRSLGYRVRRFGWHDITRRGDLTLAEVQELVAVAVA